MIQIIAADMDGTLLDETGFITENTKKMIDDLNKSGVFVVPATGRCWDEIPDEMNNMKGIQYAILANGARIVDLKNDKTLYINTLELKNVLPLLTIIIENDLSYDFVSEGSVFIDECFMEDVLHNYKAAGKGFSWMPERYRFVKNLPAEASSRNMKLEKISIRRILPEKMEVLKHFFSEYPELTVTSYVFRPGEPITLEIGPEGCTKGQALKTLCSMLEFDMANAMAIGDGYNDVSMLSVAGFGVAMGNAVEEVKAVADYVTLSNKQEGATLALRKFVLTQ